MNENEIKEILLNGENVTLECKRVKSEVLKLVNSLIMVHLY